MEKTIKYLENGEYHYATVKDVGDLAKLKTDSKDDLVTAINELFITGGEAPKKPDGYDELVDNVADAIQKQQQMTDTITNMQQSAQLSDVEMEHMKQVQEELHQEYLKAIKELNEAVDKAKADAADLDKKTSDLQDKLDETFASVDKEVSDVHKQLDSESAGLRKDLDDTKTSLESTRKDLLNNTQEFGVVNSEVKELKDKMDRRIWSTDLDPVREQVNKNTTEVSQTKDELKNKADQSSLDLVTNSVENLSTQVKENADGLKVAVKRDELGGDVARLLNDKTNLLLGTRNFSGDSWGNKTFWHEEAGYWKGLKVFSSTEIWFGLQYKYEVKQGQQYTFSFWARQEKDNSSASIVLSESDKGDQGITTPYTRGVHIGTEWKRYSLTFQVVADGIIYPRVEQNVQGNKLYIAGYKLELGNVATPWEPNEADVAENIEHTESQFNVYSDQIAGIVKKQEKMGDTERQLDTRITETAEGLKQTSKDLQDANGKITEFKGQLESTARGLKTEYEKYTNDAVGQISDSSLNLIHNSAFSSQDNQFESWQNISAKATVREDSNNLHWVELTQSGQGTDNPIGVTSNYFIVKQGKVTVAVDVKLGNKANLDNQNILLLELYDENKKRVDFTDVSVSQLGLSMSVLNDHNVHRGLYRLGIDRKDVKYMTVKAILHRNGDLWLTNFSARLSSIDDGGYTPNPDDVNHQILKMNTKIEEDAEHIALKANSVDVTRDIKSAVDGIDISGVNLLRNTDPKQIDEVESDSTWILGSFGNGSAKVIDLPNSNIFTAKHGFEIYGNTNGNRDFTQRPIHWTNNKYVFSVYARIADVSSAKSVDMMTRAWSNQTNRAVFENHYTLTSKQWTRVTMSIDASSFYDQTGVSLAFGLSGYGSIDFAQPMLELANKASKWSPNPQDTSAEIKSAKDAAIQVASDQINIHVNELSTSFDDKLNKRVNEVKTASEKFTSDGIEQVVTKVTNVKNNFDRLGDTVKSTGSRNLLHNTSDRYKTLTGNGYLAQSTASDIYTSTANYHSGDWFTYAATITNNSSKNVHLETWLFDQNKRGLDANSIAPIQLTTHSADVYPGEKDKRVSTSFQISGTTWFIRTYVIFGGGGAPNGSQVQVKDERLVEGRLDGSWSPNPEDIEQTIKDATEYKTVTGTIDFNNLKTQQKIFYKDTQATNTPAGGNYWYYLNVEPGTDGRIFQTAISDRDNITWVRTFADSWSPWIKQADQRNVDDLHNQINGFKTETTASVKNLGDRVTTEVNSVETRVNNKIDGIQVGGRNILSNTEDLVYKAKVTNSANNPNSGDSMWKLAVGNLSDWLRNNPDVKEIAISYDYELQGATPTGTIRFGVNQAPAWEYMSGFNLQGKPAKGRVKLIVPVTDNMRETASKISRIRGDGLPIGATLIISHPKWEVGNKATDWSPAPEDTVEAIKEVNTKWDVANGQIQGKVTETDVNNILNGKGYATQSWAESNFRMKSDSIELEVRKITDPISNKINNLQVGGRNLLHGTSDQWRKFTSSGWGCFTTAQSSEVSMAEYHTGNVFTYSATISNNGKHDVALQLRPLNSQKKPISYYASAPVKPGQQNMRVSCTAPVDENTWYMGVWVYFPSNNGSNDVVWVKEEQLEEENVRTPWTPNPDDTIEAIKEVNTKWDIANGQIQGKVTATDVNNILNGKGYATTSTVQSLITQKAGTISESITNLDAKYNATVTQVQSLTASIDGLQSNVTNLKNDTSSKYTQLSNLMQSKVGTADFNNLKRSVDMQKLDSADINNMKTNGHYFVRNLANNPIGGWVYVDVTGNGNDRIRQDVYQDNGNKHKYRRWFGTYWTGWEEGATESEITQLRDDINLRVKSGDLLSQINLTAHNTLIQSGKIYLDSSSTVFSGKAFIPSAAIVSLDADKINTGTLNTRTVSIGDDQTRLWARSNYLYLTGKDQGNAYNMRLGGDRIEFVTTEIPNNAPYMDGITPMYQIAYDGDTKSRLKIRSFNRLTGSNEFPIEMYDSVNISKDQLDFAANNQMKMQVVDGGVNIRPTLFLQNNTRNGTWAGFTRLDNSDTVEFNTGNNNGENFHVNSGARFRQYLYVDGWLSCYQLKQTSLLSEKTDIEELDPEEALNMVRQDKQYLYKYKQDVQKGIIDQQAGLIIDDQNNTPVYTPPKVFLDSTGKSREPNVELAYLIAAFQELDRRNQKLERDIRELKGEVIHE